MNDQIKERLDELAVAHGGRLTAQQVLEEARSADSPLHGEFTWDNAKAAEERRLDQARHLLRGYKIRVVVEDVGFPIKVPAFLRDPARAATDQGYVSVVVLRDEEANKREAMSREVERLLRQVGRLKNLAVVLGVMDELVGIQQAVDDLLGSLRRAA